MLGSSGEVGLIYDDGSLDIRRVVQHMLLTVIAISNRNLYLFL